VTFMSLIEHAQHDFGLDRQDSDSCDHVVVVVQATCHYGIVEGGRRPVTAEALGRKDLDETAAKYEDELIGWD
jgi:hypothetical protein